jgi:hypothetical protein
MDLLLTAGVQMVLHMKARVTHVETGGAKLICLSAKFKEHQLLVTLVLAAKTLTSMLEAVVVGLHQ